MSDRLHRIKKALLADRKKSALMVMLVAVGLLLWGRVLARRVPRTAIADPNSALTSAGAKPRAASSVLKSGDQIVYVDFDDALRRDLFRIEGSRFEKLSGDGQSPRKFNGGLSDDEDSRQAGEGRLRLQSTILGHRPRAFINGRLLKPGQEIDGATLKKVGHRQVTMERHGEDFVLRMNVVPPQE